VSEKDQIDFIARVVSVVCGYDSTLATTMAASAASLKIMYEECANPRKPTFAKAMVKDFVQLLELVINKKTAPAAGSYLARHAHEPHPRSAPHQEGGRHQVPREPQDDKGRKVTRGVS
jgi:hypothetical protein